MTFPSDGFVYFLSSHSSSHRRVVSRFPAGGGEFVTVRVETTIPREIAAAGRRRRRFVDCECRTERVDRKTHVRVWYVHRPLDEATTFDDDGYAPRIHQTRVVVGFWVTTPTAVMSAV